MVTRVDVQRIQAANQSIARLAIRDLEAFWSTLDLTRPEAARDALLEFVPTLTATYGEVAAVVAADWYEDLRAASGAPGRFAPLLADPVPAVAVHSTVRFGARHLWTDTPTQTLSFLNGAVQRYALQPGRETIILSARQDPWRPRFARVPSGPTTCAFCLMLASRGPVYWSRQTAGEMSKFHSDCDCAVVPIGPRDELPDGYDPEALYRMYIDARSMAESRSTSDVLAELRRQQGVA